jgi:hypothetical protein
MEFRCKKWAERESGNFRDDKIKIKCHFLLSTVISRERFSNTE